LRIGSDFRDGLASVNQPRVAARVVGWSVLATLLSAVANDLLFRAFGLPLPFTAALLLLVVLQVGSVPPSLPGRLGVFNYLTVLTLGLYGVDRVPAAAYSLGLYTVAYVPKVLLGAACLARRDWRRPVRAVVASGSRASESEHAERVDG
jgi:glycosyltransferase 2 family protein